MALYNVRERKKVSESFYFDMMSPPVKKMLETHVPFEDDSSLSRSCIFHLSHPSPDIFLVIRVRKLVTLGSTLHCRNLTIVIKVATVVCAENNLMYKLSY